jgi:hypothetical protein
LIGSLRAATPSEGTPHITFSGKLWEVRGVSRLYPDYGFHIHTSPARRPPPLVGHAIDPSCPPELWSWLPGVQFPAHFRPPAALSFWGYRTTAGHRAFFPLWSWEQFVRVGARYGVAVLDAGVGREQDPVTGEYHAVMMLFAEKARRSREYASHDFDAVADLRVFRTGGRGVLPPALGVPSGETGPGWTISELLAEGRERVGAERRAETAACIAYGLYAAAQIRPEPGPLHDRFRAALFVDADYDPSDDAVPLALLEEVAVAIDAIYLGRLEKESSETGQTDDALRALSGSGAKDHLLKQIRGRVQRRTNWPEPLIDAAIREWYWRSIRYTCAALSAATGRFLELAVRPRGAVGAGRVTFPADVHMPRRVRRARAHDAVRWRSSRHHRAVG